MTDLRKRQNSIVDININDESKTLNSVKPLASNIKQRESIKYSNGSIRYSNGAIDLKDLQFQGRLDEIKKNKIDNVLK